MSLIHIAVVVLLAIGFSLLWTAIVDGDGYSYGQSGIRKIQKWNKTNKTMWDIKMFKVMVAFAAKHTYMDKTDEEILQKRLNRAGIQCTAAEFKGRKYVLVFITVVLVCIFLLFKSAVFAGAFGMLGVVLLVMESKDVDKVLAKKDAEIKAEMPRFIRAVCRNLKGNRDIISAITAYRKVSGYALGLELDILISEMKIGSISGGLHEFSRRIGTDEAHRFCSALQEMERGIDQTATLDYLATEMARQTKFDMQKELSKRPGQMRMTYLPAVGVCVVMIMYVLIMYIGEQFSNVF